MRTGVDAVRALDWLAAAFAEASASEAATAAFSRSSTEVVGCTIGWGVDAAGVMTEGGTTTVGDAASGATASRAKE